MKIALFTVTLAAGLFSLSALAGGPDNMMRATRVDCSKKINAGITRCVHERRNRQRARCRADAPILFDKMAKAENWYRGCKYDRYVPRRAWCEAKCDESYKNSHGDCFSWSPGNHTDTRVGHNIGSCTTL
jgi:hypothetical protein